LSDTNHNNNLQFKPEAMIRRRRVLLLSLAGLWVILVQSQPSDTVRASYYNVLYNTSVGRILCATDQPQLVHNDTRSRLHCSATCLHNDRCFGFNFKNASSTASRFTCEHFDDYPSNFTVDSSCRYYAVRALNSVTFGIRQFCTCPAKNSLLQFICRPT